MNGERIDLMRRIYFDSMADDGFSIYRLAEKIGRARVWHELSDEEQMETGKKMNEGASYEDVGVLYTRPSVEKLAELEKKLSDIRRTLQSCFED